MPSKILFLWATCGGKAATRGPQEGNFGGGAAAPELPLCGPRVAALPPHVAHKKRILEGIRPPNLPENADCVSPVISNL